MQSGYQSWVFENRPVITAEATVVGPEEGAGPLGHEYDIVHGDTRLEQETWEKAERTLMEEAAKLAIENAGLTKEKINFFIGGDLLNQIVSSSFSARTLSVPYLGLFGACSTSMESLALAAMIVNGSGAEAVLSGTCSHNSTVEKQFRFPTEYGAQKPPSAQHTVTGAGACVVRPHGDGPVVTSATIGRVVDMGITDPFNMGAAMAPAAVDTIQAHFRDLNLAPEHYDLIITGDLAAVGYEIAHDLLQKHGVDMTQTTFKDCGLMVYDVNQQQVHAGGSGCACSAVVTYGHIMKQLRQGILRRVLVVATGALLSPLTVQQNESIPCIAHAVSIEHVGGGD